MNYYCLKHWMFKSTEKFGPVTKTLHTQQTNNSDTLNMETKMF